MIKYWFICPRYSFGGWWVKGTYDQVVNFGTQKMIEEGITPDKFPMKWDTVHGHLDENGQEVIDNVIHNVCNTYEEALDIEEVTDNDFLDSLDYDEVKEKGESWILTHKNSYFEIL